jgi:hypothetical protein
MAGLEQVRDIFDRGGIGLVLIGIPGIEKRLARYPQFYSRIGFVHEFRSLDAKEVHELLDQRWTPLACIYRSISSTRKRPRLSSGLLAAASGY